MEYNTQSKECKIICSNPLRSPSSISSISSTNAHQYLYNFLIAFSFGWLAHFHSWEFLFPRFFLSARIPPCLTLEDTPFFSLCLQLFHTPLRDTAIDSRACCVLSSTHQRFYALLVFVSWHTMSLTSSAEHCFIPRHLRKGRHTWALQR